MPPPPQQNAAPRASAKASGDEEADPFPKVGDLAHVAQPVPGYDEAMEAARKRAADALQTSQEGIAKVDLDSEEASKKLKTLGDGCSTLSWPREWRSL
eukprot:6861387-Pyramimonas_sp.AAC.1